MMLMTYQIPNFQLFRNDFMPHGTRTPYGTAVYVKESVNFLSEPLRCNYNDVEITLIKLNQPVHNIHIIGIYRSKSKVKTSRFIYALKILHSNVQMLPLLYLVILISILWKMHLTKIQFVNT